MADRKQNDHWAEKAKAMGYPARSVFKLEEMANKHNLFKNDNLVLDLGAAPGSWSLYLARKERCRVVACDLKPLALKHHPLIVFYQGNFLDAKIAQKLASHGLYDVVVCDAAPATSGYRDVDCAKSHELVATAMALATTYLKQGGHLVVKVFQNGDEKDLLEQLKTLYNTVLVAKPQAVRKESFECYFIAKGLK